MRNPSTSRAPKESDHDPAPPPRVGRAYTTTTIEPHSASTVSAAACRIAQHLAKSSTDKTSSGCWRCCLRGARRYCRASERGVTTRGAGGVGCGRRHAATRPGLSARRSFRYRPAIARLRSAAPRGIAGAVVYERQTALAVGAVIEHRALPIRRSDCRERGSGCRTAGAGAGSGMDEGRLARQVAAVELYRQRPWPAASTAVCAGDRRSAPVQNFADQDSGA